MLYRLPTKDQNQDLQALLTWLPAIVLDVVGPEAYFLPGDVPPEIAEEAGRV